MKNVEREAPTKKRRLSREERQKRISRVVFIAFSIIIIFIWVVTLVYR